jgi:hypothetical protein
MPVEVMTACIRRPAVVPAVVSSRLTARLSLFGRTDEIH